MEEQEPVLTPCTSGRTSSNSPEFEFWIVGNPSFPQPNLLSADELFSGGVLLPLHHLHLSEDTPPQPPGSDHQPDPQTSAVDLLATAAPALTSSKRWKDIIFKKNEKTTKEKLENTTSAGVKEKKRRRDKKNGSAGASAAELNINIWPFSRSRSAGTGGTRARAAPPSRKVSSAPCSRSNSRGDSKSRKWPTSPTRPGMHLGRTSPVWQVRRTTTANKDANDARRKVPVAAGSKARVLSLNVPMCIGYRHQLSCRSDGVTAVDGGGSNGRGVSGEGVRGGNLFNIKSLFTRKVY